MKTLHFIVFIFLPAIAFEQTLQLRKRIDSTVLIIDTKPAKTYSFIKQDQITKNKKLCINYLVKYSNDHLTYIARTFSNKDSSVKQTFFLQGSLLIFSSESIYYYYDKDSIGWGGAYYFVKEKMIYYETLGHGKSEIETWNPEAEVLRNYYKSRSDVSAYLKRKNGG